MWEGGQDLAFFWQVYPKEMEHKSVCFFVCLVEVN